MKTKALFLDRDGVINEDFGYISSISEFKFIDGVFDALRGFMKIGYELIIITNQSGIGRGYYSESDFFKITEHMTEIFQNEEIEISKIYYCPHSPDALCSCRKPNPGMILKAIEEFDIDAKNSILVGDKQSDIQAGTNAEVGHNFLIGKDCVSLIDLYNKIKNKEISWE